MDCYPPCKTCTGLCTQPPSPAPSTSARRVASIPRKRGSTELVCGHTVPADEITLTVLGDGLGAQPYCDRCGDFRSAKKKKKTRKIQADLGPMF